MDRWLGVETVARQLGVSGGTVRKWIHRGVLPADRTQSGRYRLRSSDGAALLQKRLAAPSSYVAPLVPRLRKERGPLRCGVYFIRCQRFVKIGLTTDLDERLKALKASNPFDVDLFLFIPTSGATEAHRLERQLHRKFRNYRQRGEWFLLCPEISDFAAVEMMKP